MIDISLKYGYRIYNSDELNIVLAKVDTVQDPKSKSFGKQTERRIGYFSNLKSALIRYTDLLTVGEYIAIKGDLEKIIAALEDIKVSVGRVGTLHD